MLGNNGQYNESLTNVSGEQSVFDRPKVHPTNFIGFSPNIKILHFSRVYKLTFPLVEDICKTKFYGY